MTNILVLHPNRADAATLSGGSWEANLPLTNAQSRVIKRVARSTDTDLTSTKFDVALDRARNMRVLVLIGHNLSPDTAKWRIQAANDSGFTDVVYDGGSETGPNPDVWPALYPTLTLDWEDENWWSGKPTAEDIAGFTWSAIHILPSLVFARYWRVEIFDELNADGYVEFGRLFMAGQWQPTRNYSYGAQLGFETDTAIEVSLAGTEFFDEREPYRVFSFSIDNLGRDEAMARALELTRRAGISGEVFVVPDPDDLTNMVRRAFLGRLRRLNALDERFHDLHGMGFELKELK